MARSKGKWNVPRRNINRNYAPNTKPMYSKVGITRLHPSGEVNWRVARFLLEGGTRWVWDANEGDFSEAEWAAEYCSGRTTNSPDRFTLFLIYPAGLVPEAVTLIEWKYHGPK